MREDDLAALRALADEVLDRVAGRYEEDLAPAIPRVWRSEVEELRTDLQGWIRSVVAAAEPWRPSHFELAFGFEEEAVVLDGKRLRGAIDLVEIHPERGTVRITDHKTGALRHKKNVVVGGGEILQPLLYALAAETLLELPAEAGRLAYCTRRGGYEDVTVRVDDRNREAVSLVLDVVDRAVQDGFLPAAPQEGACRYCDYRLICGPHEERRIRRKHPQRLVMLQQLRDLP
jgi:CRISPR/Cas system-associated exonuclease Cas4 (RecB family)